MDDFWGGLVCLRTLILTAYETADVSTQENRKLLLMKNILIAENEDRNNGDRVKESEKKMAENRKK